MRGRRAQAPLASPARLPDPLPGSLLMMYPSVAGGADGKAGALEARGTDSRLERNARGDGGPALPVRREGADWALRYRASSSILRVMSSTTSSGTSIPRLAHPRISGRW